MATSEQTSEGSILEEDTWKLLKQSLTLWNNCVIPAFLHMQSHIVSQFIRMHNTRLSGSKSSGLSQHPLASV